MRGHTPVVAEGVNDLAVPVSPDHRCDRPAWLCPGIDRLIEHCVRVLHIQVEGGRRQWLAGRGGHSRKLVSKENDGIAYLKFGVVYTPVGRRHAHPYRCAERVLV